MEFWGNIQRYLPNRGNTEVKPAGNPDAAPLSENRITRALVLDGAFATPRGQARFQGRPEVNFDPGDPRKGQRGNLDITLKYPATATETVMRNEEAQVRAAVERLFGRSTPYANSFDRFTIGTERPNHL